MLLGRKLTSIYCCKHSQKLKAKALAFIKAKSSKSILTGLDKSDKDIHADEGSENSGHLSNINMKTALRKDRMDWVLTM